MSIRQPRLSAPVLSFLVSAAMLGGPGCIGGHFEPKGPARELDKPTQMIVDRLTAERATKPLPAPTWVPELHTPAVRAALSVTRGDQGLSAAAHQAAQAGVSAMGRHVWSFATDCTDPSQVLLPPLVSQEKTLLFAAAAAPGPAGHHTVILLIAEPGPSALRAEQMGGGRGGNPTLATYAHPSVSGGPCGEGWPLAARGP